MIKLGIALFGLGVSLKALYDGNKRENTNKEKMDKNQYIEVELPDNNIIEEDVIGKKDRIEEKLKEINKSKEKDKEDIDLKIEEEKTKEKLEIIDNIKKDIQYFIVNQNNKFDNESKGGYIWASKKNKNGNNIYHWDELKNIEEGDIVYSIVNRQIVSINKAIDDYYNSDNPVKTDSMDDWEIKGRKVDLEYNILEKPISIEDRVDEIIKRNPDKYAPFNKNGGVNSGYLFNTGKELGEYLIEEIRKYNDIKL